MFSKRFPKETEGSVYPKWIDVTLSAEEESAVEQEARKENNALFKECLADAQQIINDLALKGYQTDAVSIAKTLFEKRASHAVYHKERKAREKFERL